MNDLCNKSDGEGDFVEVVDVDVISVSTVIAG